MKSTLEVLTEARAHISDPSRHTQDGKWCKGDAYCALGVIARYATGVLEPYSTEVSHPYSRHAVDALARAAGTLGEHPDITVADTFLWNDEAAHTEVLAAFDRAIANERAKQQEFTVTPLTEPAHA